MIMPGVGLMLRSLHEGTAALPDQDGEFSDYPTQTVDAIASGCQHAQAGAIERLYALEVAHTPGLICLLSGGAVRAVAPRIAIPFQLHENLVLEGLYTIAQATPCCAIARRRRPASRRGRELGATRRLQASNQRFFGVRCSRPYPRSIGAATAAPLHREGARTMSKVHVIHENDAWVEPLRAAFAEIGVPFAEWFIDDGSLDLDAEPPQGVFYNRMSASSHTRGHRYAPELTAGVLAWLEAHDRRVVNNGRALQLEVSKIAQYEALRRHGIRTPRTIAAVGNDALVAAARQFSGRFITKHNRAGKGLGVKLFDNVAALEAHVHSDAFEPSVDGITLIQQYIAAPQPFITRVEFVGGKFLYAVRVDTSLGFELCPADVCQVGDAFCPVGETAPAAAARRAALFDHRRLFAPDRRALRALHRRQRHRHRRHRVHHRSRRRAVDVRRQHQHQLQPGRREGRRQVRHARDRALPGRRAAPGRAHRARDDAGVEA